MDPIIDMGVAHLGPGPTVGSTPTTTTSTIMTTNHNNHFNYLFYKKITLYWGFIPIKSTTTRTTTTTMTAITTLRTPTTTTTTITTTAKGMAEGEGGGYAPPQILAEKKAPHYYLPTQIFTSRAIPV